MPMRMAVFLCVSLSILAVFEKRRRHTEVTYDENEAAVLSLTEDRGYWRAQRFNHKDEARMRGTLQDFRYGARILWKAPALSATAVILIALVIGGNTTVFSMVHAFITRPAPGVTADGLVSFGLAGSPGDMFHPLPEFLRYQEQAKTIRSLSAVSPERFTLGLDSGSYALLGSGVTSNYFQTLGVSIIRGRGFTDAENRPGVTSLVAVISDELWQEQFQRSMSAVGQQITLNGHPATIIGVASPRFHGAFLGAPEDLWVPLLNYSLLKAQLRLANNLPFEPFGVAIIGQLVPGMALARAQAEFATLSSSSQARDRSPQQQRILAVIPYSSMAFGGAIGLRQFVPVFSIVTLLTLIVVCANVANLMLGRAVVRQRETAVRQSLGASRIRIVRMLFAEGLTISVVAWAIACVFSFWMTKIVVRFLPTGTNPLTGIRMSQASIDFAPDWQVLAYAMVLACIGTVAFSVAPAFHAWRQEPLSGLKTGEHSIARGPSILTRVLVLAQLAFSVVLLTSAGLAYRSFAVTNAFDVRFNKDNLLLVTVNPTLNIPARQANLAVVEKLRERFRAIPGIESVSYARNWSRDAIWMNSREPLPARVNYVGPDYLRVLGLATRAGREFSAGDRGPQNNLAVINQSLADKLWPKQLAVGQTLVFGRDKQPLEVIGVAPNAFFSGALDEASPDFVFLAEQQDQTRRTGGHGMFESGETTFYLRYSRDLSSLTSLISRAIKEIDARVPVSFIRTMDTQLSGSIFALRAVMTLLTMFASVSLIIAAIGQYAVMAFDAKRRNRELGVRIALGASSQQILATVLKEGLVLTGIGLLLGFIISTTIGLAFRASLPGVTPTDLRTYLGVFIVLGCASFVACYLPARRASRVDPMVTLRHE
jgi:predicted permease